MKPIIYLLFLSLVVSCNLKSTVDRGVSLQKGFIETKIIQEGKIWSLDWSPDDKYIACGNAQGIVRIYSSSDMELETILTGFKSTINSIHWSPDGSLLAASGGHQDPRVIIWNLEERTSIEIDDHSRQVRTVRWSPEGTYLASTSHDGTIRIWTSEGTLVKVFTGANFGCVGIDWLDEDVIAASCWDNTIRTYSLSGVDSLIIENGDHRAKAVLAIDWHPRGSSFATGEYGNEGDPVHAVKLWNKNGELIREMTSHEKEIRSLAWNAEGNLLATGGETVRLWNSDGDLLKVFEPIISPIWSLDWNKAGDKIVTGHNDGKIRMWNTDGELLYLLDGHSSEKSAVSFNADSSKLFVGFSDGTLRFFDLEGMSTSTVKAHSRSIRNIVWSPDENHIAINSRDGAFSLWEVTRDISGSVPLFDKEGHSGKAIAWSPDGLSIAYLDYNSRITVYSREGEVLYTVEAKSGDDNGLEWKVDQPASIPKGGPSDYITERVEVLINKEPLALIPLANNQFALIDTTSNRIVKGDKNDFVLIRKEGYGFTNLHTL